MIIFTQREKSHGIRSGMNNRIILDRIIIYRKKLLTHTSIIDMLYHIHYFFIFIDYFFELLI